MKLTESTEMLKEAERQGAVKIMIPVSELKFMLQQASKVEEMQKVMQDIHDKLNNGASHEFEETIQYCVTKAFYALKGESQ